VERGIESGPASGLEVGHCPSLGKEGIGRLSEWRATRYRRAGLARKAYGARKNTLPEGRAKGFTTQRFRLCRIPGETDRLGPEKSCEPYWKKGERERRDHHRGVREINRLGGKRTFGQEGQSGNWIFDPKMNVKGGGVEGFGRVNGHNRGSARKGLTRPPRVNQETAYSREQGKGNQNMRPKKSAAK